MIESTIEYKTNIINQLTELIEVRPSPIEGLGLFAKKFISKGTIWWTATPCDVLLINRDQYLTLKNSIESSSSQNFEQSILVYSYYVLRYDALVFCLDNSRYVNHSYKPNSGNTPDFHPFSSIALRDIFPGEEILEDYSTYDQCPWIIFNENFLSQKPIHTPLI